MRCTSRPKSSASPGVGTAQTSSSRKSRVSSWMRHGRDVCAVLGSLSDTPIVSRTRAVRRRNQAHNHPRSEAWAPSHRGLACARVRAGDTKWRSRRGARRGRPRGSVPAIGRPLSSARVRRCVGASSDARASVYGRFSATSCSAFCRRSRSRSHLSARWTSRAPAPRGSDQPVLVTWRRAVTSRRSSSVAVGIGPFGSSSALLEDHENA